MGNYNNATVDINIGLLFSELFKKKFAIIAIVISCLAGSLAFTKFLITPMYTSRTSIIVFNGEASSMTTQEIATSQYLLYDYREIIVSRTVLEKVNDELGLNYSYERLKSSIRLEAPEDTRVIEIYVTTASPSESMRIANTVREVARTRILEVMKEDRIEMVDDANLPKAPSSPNMVSNGMYGVLVGLIISAIMVLVSTIRNDKISGEEDVKRHLGLPTLGVIPYNDSAKSNKGARGYGEQ